MTADPEFAIPDPPPQGGTSVALSDKTLLAVSLAGFVVLATTVYILVIRPSLTAEEIDDEGTHNYDDELDHADVRTLNRAQRRARARNRMKRNRRVDPRTPGQLHQQHEDLDEGADDADGGAAVAQQQLLAGDEAAAAVPDGNDSSQQHLSRKERARLAKAKEREERKLFEKERQEQRRKAEAAAAVERREREKEREALAQEERRRREAEAHNRELTEHREWTLMFLESRNNAEATVREFICKARSKKIWPIEDISREYGASPEKVEIRLRQLLADDRMFGVVSNGNFIYLEPNDMKSIAERIKENGRTSLSELGREICRVATGSIAVSNDSS